MKLENRLSRVSRGPLTRLAATLLCVSSLFWSTLAVAAGNPVMPAEAPSRGLSESQKIAHVLNRMGFGARPGDVERVRAIGLDRYVEQQLHPESIPDPVAEAKVQALPTLTMTTAELYAKFPQPGQLIQKLQREGALPADLAALRDDRAKGGNVGQTARGAAAGQQNAGTAAMTPATQGTPNAAAPAGAAGNKDYREAIRQYYMQNNLQPPQRITMELQASRILRAVYSERQLQEEMVDFWTNHFNIFAGKGADRWLLTSYDRDTIRPNTMGKFYDLLVATAESPAMLFYLDNFQSVSPNARPGGNGLNNRAAAREQLFGILMGGRAGQAGARARANGGQQMPQAGANRPAQQQQQPRRGINENYARELMELHTLGVDGGYTQKDVQEVARCFTGWTIFNPRGAGQGMQGMNSQNAGKFYFNPRLHDDGEKTVLGQKIPAGGGMKDGLMVLNILAHHPSTAKFVSTKLCRRFVMDNPSPALVARISAAYMRSDGDIRETLRAIFTSPEFNSPEAYRAKIKRPFDLAVSAIRALGADTNGGPSIHQWIARMGEPLYAYQAPTGYPDVAENWVNTGALLERLNFALALASNKIPGTRVDLARFVGDKNANSADVDRTTVLNRFIDVILQGDVTATTKSTLVKQLSAPAAAAPAATEMDRAADAQVNPNAARREVARNDATVGNPEVTKIVGLILGSPEFQRQ